MQEEQLQMLTPLIVHLGMFSGFPGSQIFKRDPSVLHYYEPIQ